MGTLRTHARTVADWLTQGADGARWVSGKVLLVEPLLRGIAKVLRKFAGAI